MREYYQDSLKLSESYRKAIPEFQRNRYSSGMSRTGSERPRSERLRILDDAYSGNRLGAVWWLGEHRVVKAVPPLLRHVNSIFADEHRHPPNAHELVVLVTALSQIGGDGVYPAVSKAYSYLVRGGSVSEVHRGLEAMERLGHKGEAEAELKQAYETHRRDPNH